MIKPVLFHSAHALLLPRSEAIDGTNDRTRTLLAALPVGSLTSRAKRLLF